MCQKLNKYLEMKRKVKGEGVHDRVAQRIIKKERKTKTIIILAPKKKESRDTMYDSYDCLLINKIIVVTSNKITVVKISPTSLYKPHPRQFEQNPELVSQETLIIPNLF
ncbi:hypothetical protein CEXT_761081 [Caerostris extrusa]|uniref:Uncharacterized protein n=1 Tax=Caerostris extrusa TaxID=172846 RepID=A0AAV4QDU9_CAEEX|nr:hypothetical protein CEXT_761081 [Caerostris extrusa]